MSKARLLSAEEINNKDIKCSPNSKISKIAQLTSKIKKVFRKLVLVFVVICYTSMGALVFQWLEHEADMIHINNVKDNLMMQKIQFLDTINCDTENYTATTGKNLLIEKALVFYEEQVEASLKEGVFPSTLNSTISESRWSFTQSIFFASTVLTTIGYGNIAPGTHMGRVFCIGFALIGIPLTLSMIADMGELLASLLPLQTIKKILPKGRWRTVISIGSMFGLLLGFIALGGLLFQYFEQDWSYLDAFYFCFITTTTIGFGDLIPDPSSMSLCGFYILIGLALTSAVIEIVRLQYVASFDQMKMLSLKIHQLSAPLADAMRKMAVSGAGELEVNTDLVKELQQLTSVLSEMHNNDSSDIENNVSTVKDPWQALLDLAEKKKRITIIMYESSV